MRFDIAIIGAGATGNTIAWLLSKKGYKVAVYEKNKEIGNKVCGGLVSERVIKYCREAVVNEIKGAEIFLPNGKKIFIGGDKTYAYVIDRKKFDICLAEKAMSEGARYFLNCRKIEKKCERLIGADGARSNIARDFKGKINYINAVQGIANSEENGEYVRVYFGKFAPGFFGWVIPAGDELRIGMGTNEKGLRKKFEEFKSMVGYEVKNERYALIPYGIKKLAKEKCAIVGDAGGQVKATSGGGLYAGLLASEIIAKNFDDFFAYEREFMRAYGEELKGCLLLRKIFLKWHRYDALEEIEVRNADFDYHWKFAKNFLIKHPFKAFKIALKCLL
ncbi:MAG: NAD(P)-binding protein [Thermoplasmatales archaeon]|nr:NAD(P)-binding protein [Thermoplasmatales archaeon]